MFMVRIPKGYLCCGKCQDLQLRRRKDWILRKPGLIQSVRMTSLEPKVFTIKMERGDLVSQKVKYKNYHCSTV